MLTPTKSSPPANEPRSLLRIFGILEIVARSPEGQTLAELALQLAAPKSSLLLLLRPLVAHGYLVHQNGKYELGAEIFQLSSEILAARSFTRIVRPYLQDLADQTGESVYLTVINREAGVATYIEGIESRNPVRYVAPAGTTRPLYLAAAGKLLLAFQDATWRDDYLARTKLTPLSGKGVISKRALRSELDEIRSSGISISISGAVQGAAGMAAPIITGDQPVSYALLISAPSERFAKSIPRLRAILSETAKNVSAILGRTGGA